MRKYKKIVYVCNIVSEVYFFMLILSFRILFFFCLTKFFLNANRLF